MDNKEIIGEQPDLDTINVADASIKKSDFDAESGSPIGKFKNADSLLNAYNELQSEFTRKCQRLSELEKSNNDNVEGSTPLYEREDWRSRLNTFFENNESAKKFSNEISQELFKDKTLASNPNALELALLKVISNHYVDEESVIKNKEFRQKLLKDKDLCDEIVNNYIKSVNNANIPTVFGNVGITGTKINRPQNLDDAKTLVENLFKR